MVVGSCLGAPTGGGCGDLGQPLELHVEVAHGAEHAAHPAQLLPEDLGSHGKDLGEELQRRPQASRGDAHVVQLFGVLAQTGARLLVTDDSQLPAHDREGQIAHGGRLGDPGRTEVRAPGNVQTHREQAGLELGESGRLETAGRAQLVHHGSSASSHSGRTSTSTRRNCMGRCPVPTTITVSSRATSATSTPPTRSAKGRRRVRTWSTSCRRRVPTMARNRRPTGPSAPREPRPSAGRTSVTSSRWRSPLPSAGRVSFIVTSSWRPRRRVRTTNPARATRQSSVSMYESTSRRGGRASAVTVPRPAASSARVGQGGQPPLHRPQVERVELPLDLDGAARRPFIPWVGHRAQATARRAWPPGGRPCAVGHARAP